MTCPPCNNNCAQGSECPARVCRQRAGKPADYDSPVWLARQQEELDAELERQWKRDMRSIVFIASCVLAFFLVVWGTLP
jgi:hypothetical protein